MIKLICFLSIVAYACSASVKREEYNPDPLLALTNQVNANRDQSSVGSNNNSPVYSPQNAYPTYSSYGNSASSNQNLVSNNFGNQADTNANQAYVDNVASATNLQSSQPNPTAYSNNNNLYYYYYPVSQDKNKDINYQASPSNQYTSSIVQPQNGDEQSNQNNPANLVGNQQVSANSANNPGHDLSYGGAQDLAYTASMNDNSNSNGQSAGYESQLSNLASQLGSFGGFGSNGAAFGNSQFANQLSGLSNLGFGEAFGSSSIQPSSVPFDPSFSAAMASQLGSFGGSPLATQSAPSSSGGPLSQLSGLYQQATQMYQGLINGNGLNSASMQPQFAASQQHASYEPSTGSGSSFRSKYGLGSVVLPLVALAGLSLLIPTVTSLSTTSRKKRSAEENLNLQQAGLGGYLDRIDRYYSLYKNAIEREECFNRIICELGDAVSGVRGKDAFFEFVERMMPNGWNKQGNSKISIFKTSALSADNSKCKKYKCH